jgi:hypothetical protein
LHTLNGFCVLERGGLARLEPVSISRTLTLNDYFQLWAGIYWSRVDEFADIAPYKYTSAEDGSSCSCLKPRSIK